MFPGAATSWEPLYPNPHTQWAAGASRCRKLAASTAPNNSWKCVCQPNWPWKNVLKVKPEYCWVWKVREKQNFLVRGGGAVLGCGRRVARSPFSTSLGCAAWCRPHLEKKMVGVEIPLFPGMLGWLIAAHLCCCSPNVLFWSSSCSVLLGTLWVHLPSCHSPLYCSTQVVLWVSLFFFR